MPYKFFIPVFGFYIPVTCNARKSAQRGGGAGRMNVLWMGSSFSSSGAAFREARERGGEVDV